MPFASPKSCSYPGCITLVRRGFCDIHRRAEISYHDPDSKRLYDSSRWKMIRRLQLSRQPWCEDCLEQGVYTPATDVHHVEQHHGDPVKFFTGKLQSLDQVCHSRRTASEVFGKNK